MPSRFAMITFLDEDGSPVYPGHALPGGGINYPSHGLPGGGNYPSQGLPGGGHIATLPVFPFDPTLPSNELPGNQPEAGNDLPRPGKKYVVRWLACHGLILVPDNSLPETAQPK